MPPLTVQRRSSDTLWDTHIRVPKRVTNSPWNKTAKTTLLKSKNIFQTIQDKPATLGTKCICLLSASVSSSFKNRCDTPCEAHFACHKVCHGVFFKNRECDMRTTQCIRMSSFKFPWLHHTDCIKVYEANRCPFGLLRTILGKIPALKA